MVFNLNLREARAAVLPLLLSYTGIDAFLLQMVRLRTHTHTHTYSREVRQESRPRDLAREPLITGHGINFNFATRPQQRSPRSGSSLIRGYYYSYIEMQPGCGRSMRTALSSILSSLLVRPSSRQGSLILFPHGYSCSPRAVFAVAIFGLRHS